MRAMSGISCWHRPSLLCLIGAAVPMLTALGPTWARVDENDPDIRRNYRAAVERASKVGEHLASALTSDNPYDRLFAIQFLQAKPASATAELAPALAALAVDRTAVPSLVCMGCRTTGKLASACWGFYGNSDCQRPIEVGSYARAIVKSLAANPMGAPLADALWPIAMRAEPDAESIAELMPAYASLVRERVRKTLETETAATPNPALALRLLMSFPVGQCGSPELARILGRHMANAMPEVRGRAAAAILVCADGSPPWRESVRAAILGLASILEDPRSAIMGELPAAPQIVLPLIAQIGRRMADPTAPSGVEGTRLLRVVAAKAAPALPGLRARLQLADESESLSLFEIIGELGPKAAALKSPIIACASRNAVASAALGTLSQLRVPLSSKDRRVLAHAYRDECVRGGSMDECQPFARVMSEAFSTGRSKHTH